MKHPMLALFRPRQMLLLALLLPCLTLGCSKAPEAKPEVKALPAAHKFLIGQKVGMTQLFDAAGSLHAVTVVKAGPCRVAYTRTKEKDGYQAVCLGFGHKVEHRANSAEKGLAKKLDTKPIRHMKEFRVADLAGAEQGQTAGVERFVAGDYVDLQGISKGHGFAGGMKRPAPSVEVP